MKAIYDQKGIWSYDPENGRIRRRNQPGQDTIGDLRVSFHVPSKILDGC